MKKSRIILLLALALLVGFTSCSRRHKREKITDPVQQEALRTRDEGIPIDSLFTKTAAVKVASPFKKIAIGKLFSEVKVSYAESADKAAREKYAEKLHDEDKMKEEAAKKAASKASEETLAEYKANFMERAVVTMKELPAEGYSPSLTIYFMIVLIAFVIIFSIRVVKTFFISPN